MTDAVVAIIKSVEGNFIPIIVIVLVLFVSISGLIGMLILFFKRNQVEKTKDGWKVIPRTDIVVGHDSCENAEDFKEKIKEAKTDGKREGVMYSDIRHQLISERNLLIREHVENESDKLFHDFYEKNLIEVILQKDSKANPTVHNSYMMYNSFIGRDVQDVIKRKLRDYLTSIKLADLTNRDLFDNTLGDAIKSLWSASSSFQDKYFSMIDQESMIFTRKDHAEKELERQHIFVDTIAGFFVKIKALIEDYGPKFTRLKEEYGITDDFLDSLGSTEGNMFR